MTSMPLEANIEELPSLTAEENASSSFLQTARSRCGIFAVDADVRDLKAERGRSCLFAKLGDLLKITGCNVRLRADPAAADRVNERRGDELADVLGIDAASRNEFDPAERAGQRLHGRKSAIHACREELHDLEAELHRGHDLRRGHTAGRHSNTVLYAPADDFFVKAGGNDELRAALDGLAALVERDDRACAD